MYWKSYLVTNLHLSSIFLEKISKTSLESPHLLEKHQPKERKDLSEATLALLLGVIWTLSSFAENIFQVITYNFSSDDFSVLTT
jgi:hypothetical protein